MAYALALMALLAGAPSAQDAVDAMLRDDDSCTASQAVDVDIPTLQATPGPYVDRCVRVVGYIGGHWLLNDPNDVRGRSLEELTEAAQKFIGQQLHAVPYPENESRVELIGRFRHCEDRYRLFEAQADEERTKAGDTRPRPPIMLAGTCHYMDYVVFSTIWRAAP